MQFRLKKLRSWFGGAILAAYGPYAAIRMWLIVATSSFIPSPTRISLASFLALCMTFAIATGRQFVPREVRRPHDWVLALYFLVFGATVLTNAVDNPITELPDANGISLTDFNAGVLFVQVAVFAGARVISAGQFVVLIHSLLVASIIGVIGATALGGFPLDFQNVPDAARGSYLMLADLLAISALAVLPRSGNRVAMGGGFLLMISALLYAIGSRTSFIAFLLVGSIGLVLTSRGIKSVLAISGVACGIIAAGWALNSGVFDDRIGGALVALEYDGSLAARASVARAGIDAILRHPIQGAYGSQLAEFGSVFAYVHNILSIWQQFGVVAFASICVWLFWMLRVSGGVIAGAAEHAPLMVGCALVAIYAVLCLIFARSYVHTAVFFGLAIASAQLTYPWEKTI